MLEALIKKRVAGGIGKFLRYMLLINLSFIILFPFIAKICAMFMSFNDTVDPTVKFIARQPTLSNILYVLFNTNYFEALRNTALLSVTYAALTTASCALVGYGLAKFRLKSAGLFICLLVLTLLIPPQTVMLPVFSYFTYFDPFGIITLIFGAPINLSGTLWPMIILGAIGFGFRAGLFTLIFRQFFTGVPDQLMEAAYVDGSGVFRTFAQIAIPLSRPVMITVFLFSFCWQWTDTFYSSLLFNNLPLMANSISSIITNFNSAGALYISYTATIVVNTAVIFAVLPIIIIFIVFQKGFVQGIERSGIVE